MAATAILLLAAWLAPDVVAAVSPGDYDPLATSSAQPYFDLEQAKKDLPRIDRELHGKTPAMPTAQGQTRFSRLGQRFEQAYVGSNPLDGHSYYESPEGIAYFSETLHGKTKCLMSGPVNSPSGKSNGPMVIACPTSTASWTKY